MKQRLQKVLARAGIASRRKCEELITLRRVRVNGKVAVLGQSVSDSDEILVNNKKIVVEEKVYVLFNKPVGVVTTVSERHGMKTIMDLVRVKQRVFPVGRLDKNSEGLMLLTNDGELANKLMHPRYEVEKEYVLVLERPLSKTALQQLERGVLIDGRKVSFSKIKVAGATVLVRVHEGRKHILRRVFEKLGCKVVRLKRLRIGPLQLGSLQSGRWRKLASTEVKRLVDFCENLTSSAR